MYFLFMDSTQQSLNLGGICQIATLSFLNHTCTCDCKFTLMGQYYSTPYILHFEVPSQILPDFSQATRPEITSPHHGLRLREVSSSTVQSRADKNETGNADLQLAYQFSFLIVKVTSNYFWRISAMFHNAFFTNADTFKSKYLVQSYKLLLLFTTLNAFQFVLSSKLDHILAKTTHLSIQC